MSGDQHTEPSTAEKSDTGPVDDDLSGACVAERLELLFEPRCSLRIDLASDTYASFSAGSRGGDIHGKTVIVDGHKRVRTTSSRIGSPDSSGRARSMTSSMLPLAEIVSMAISLAKVGPCVNCQVAADGPTPTRRCKRPPIARPVRLRAKRITRRSRALRVLRIGELTSW